MTTTRNLKQATYRNSNWIVIVWDGRRIPANDQAEANAIVDRLAARGIDARARIAV